jgi:hypothetical protein
MSLNILTAKEFESQIKRMIIDKHPITMIDAIVLYCQEKNIEIETAAKLITPKMKNAIEGEAVKAKLIKTGKARLPID